MRAGSRPSGQERSAPPPEGHDPQPPSGAPFPSQTSRPCARRALGLQRFRPERKSPSRMREPARPDGSYERGERGCGVPTASLSFRASTTWSSFHKGYLGAKDCGWSGLPHRSPDLLGDARSEPSRCLGLIHRTGSSPDRSTVCGNGYWNGQCHPLACPTHAAHVGMLTSGLLVARMLE